MNALERAKNAFLTIHYKDSRRKLETWRIYDRNGEVHIFDGENWRTDYSLTADEIKRVQAALKDCNVLNAESISAGNVHDAATLIWEWSLPDGKTGTVTNRAYPAVKHPATECVMSMLLDIEDAYMENPE
jgi:hypothetical protein